METERGVKNKENVEPESERENWWESSDLENKDKEWWMKVKRKEWEVDRKSSLWNWRKKVKRKVEKENKVINRESKWSEKVDIEMRESSNESWEKTERESGERSKEKWTDKVERKYLMKYIAKIYWESRREVVNENRKKLERVKREVKRELEWKSSVIVKRENS